MSNYLLNGMIIGMKDMGATYVKSDYLYLYFDVKEGSEIDDKVKLKRAKEAFWAAVGMDIKIRRVK